jgi:hypothetical protein
MQAGQFTTQGLRRISHPETAKAKASRLTLGRSKETKNKRHKPDFLSHFPINTHATAAEHQSIQATHQYADTRFLELRSY